MSGFIPLVSLLGVWGRVQTPLTLVEIKYIRLFFMRFQSVHREDSFRYDDIKLAKTYIVTSFIMIS